MRFSVSPNHMCNYHFFCSSSVLWVSWISFPFGRLGKDSEMKKFAQVCMACVWKRKTFRPSLRLCHDGPGAQRPVSPTGDIVSSMDFLQPQVKESPLCPVASWALLWGVAPHAACACAPRRVLLWMVRSRVQWLRAWALGSEFLVKLWSQCLETVWCWSYHWSFLYLHLLFCKMGALVSPPQGYCEDKIH